jgi:tetratricopeptide (TPR) repeat protein
MQNTEFSWFEVPEDVKQLLKLAADNWENTSESEKYINQALAKTGDNIDVLISAYRYFYYKQNYKMALETAEKVKNKVKQTENLPENWKQLKPVLINRKEEQIIRLYLNCYAATGLILAILGKEEQAKEICNKVKEIDDKNDFGTGILFDVLTRHPEEDD